MCESLLLTGAEEETVVVKAHQSYNRNLRDGLAQTLFWTDKQT